MRAVRDSLATWGVAGTAVILLIGGSIYLAREQWRNELADANAAATADVERLSGLIGGELRLGNLCTGDCY